jgi:hypothetical protein
MTHIHKSISTVPVACMIFHFLKNKYQSSNKSLPVNANLGRFITELVSTRSSVVVKALCYKPKGRGFDTRGGDFFLNLPNPSGRARPWRYSASNRNEYQKHKNNVSAE